jgi:mRNA-degrading endonuclease RelE of RelBE toxin-antitoxin system
MRRYETECDPRRWDFQSSALPTELPSQTIENKELGSFFRIPQSDSLFYFCPMKRNETYRVADASKPPRKPKGAFDQVLDEAMNRVRGLWIRNLGHHTRVRFSPMHIKRLQFQNAKTIPQPGAAWQELSGIAKDTSNPTQPRGVNTRLRNPLTWTWPPSRMPACCDQSRRSLSKSKLRGCSSRIPNLKRLEEKGKHHRIRAGGYRGAFAFEHGTVTFARCLDRKEIYQYSP